MIFKVTGVIALMSLLMSASCEHVTSSADTNTNSSTEKMNAMNVAFYNVENLFDVTDDPKKMDEDFTPTGKLKWDTERYKVKLQHLADVFDVLPGDLPVFAGMCEIENRAVMMDLVKEQKLLPGHYAIIHKDSPDERGIDVAAIYDSTKMSIEYFHYTTINLPDDKDPYTRDLLYVKAKANGEILHFFVNHWPSRGGGQAESEKNRIAVANVLESLSNKILAEDKNAKILVMGDFNDYPTDKSIAEVLNAGITKTNTFFDYMYDDHASKHGSYFYKGEWGALDQFLGTPALKDGSKGWCAPENSAVIFYDDMILFQDKDGNKRPNRTYAGDDYKGGYSDHLPVYITLTWK